MAGLVGSALDAKVKVMIMTTTVIGEDLSVDHNRTLIGYNNFLRVLAREKHCPLADVDADFRETLGSPNRGPGAILTADGVHLNPHGEELAASRVLKTFGLTQEQVDRLHESWRNIPDAWELRANYDKGNGKMFLVRKLITIRQYERLQQMGAAKKQSTEELVGALHADNIASLIKPRGEIDSYDAIFERKLQEGLQPTLQASFGSDVDRLLKPDNPGV